MDDKRPRMTTDENLTWPDQIRFRLWLLRRMADDPDNTGTDRAILARRIAALEARLEGPDRGTREE
jgi:hypothetical protein